MRSALPLLCLALLACQSEPEEAGFEAFAPPPAVIVPTACAPGSAFELNSVAYADLQTAVEAATGGDTVVICRGSHAIGNVQSWAAGVTVAGETGDPADVHLSGGRLSFGANPWPVPAGTTTTLSGVTLDGTRITAASVGHFVAADLAFVGPDAALYVESETNYVLRTSFTGGGGSGPRLDVGPSAREAMVALDDVIFAHNTADPSLVVVHNLDFTPAHGRLRMRDVQVLDNVSVAAGSDGLIQADNDLVLEIEGGSALRNTVPAGAVLSLFDLRGPSRIRDWTVADNVVGYPALNLAGNPVPLQLRDSAFLRNSWPNAPFGLGSALVIEGPTARLSNVDLGTGADTNLPADIGLCGVDYGVIASAVIRYPSYCPR